MQRKDNPLKKQLDKIIKEIDKFIDMAKKPKVRKFKKVNKTPAKPVKVKPFSGGGDGDADADDGVGGVHDGPNDI